MLLDNLALVYTLIVKTDVSDNLALVYTLIVKTDVSDNLALVYTLIVKTDVSDNLALVYTLIVKTDVSDNLALVYTLIVKTDVSDKLALVYTLIVKTDVSDNLALVYTLIVKTDVSDNLALVYTLIVKTDVSDNLALVYTLIVKTDVSDNLALVYTLIVKTDVSDNLALVYTLIVKTDWESFRSLIGRRSKADNSVKGGRGEERGVGVERRPPSRAGDGSTMTLSRRTDLTHLMDYSPHRLAEQLTLMEQDLFQRTHPVHYLDSKSQGIGVDLSIPSLRTPSMARKAKPGSQSLFVGATLFEPRISELIAHSQEITHWVSAEILCCGSQKSQVAALSKFVQTAQLCVDIGNHATALAVLAGLDSLLVRQLPAWKHLPAKTATLMDHLDHTQVRLKGEPMVLMQNKESHIYPTIPCILYFLLHLQQLEIGGFTLANGMYRWHKMRSISQMIDQIRIFREHQYGFEPDYELQSLICRRLHELSDRDLHSVAAAHDNNFRRVISHATGIQGTWRKVKVKLHSRKK
ncbi:hypothetical protein ACOMHN_005482 [Nucella lapillus]